MALLITLIQGLFFGIGLILVKIRITHLPIEDVSIGLAAGAMTSLLCFDLAEEVVENFSEIGPVCLLFVVLGFLILTVLDRFIPEHGADEAHHEEGAVHIGTLTAVAIIVHNVLEGMSVYNIASADPSAGLSLMAGVGLHNIPLGILLFSTVKKKWLIILAVFSTFLGGLLMLFLGPLFGETFMGAMVCVTAGMVIYLIVMELVPSVLKSKNRGLSLTCFLLGFVSVSLAHTLHHHH